MSSRQDAEHRPCTLRDLHQEVGFALAAVADLQRGSAIAAPDLSLRTVSIGCFGGNAAQRGKLNIGMLAQALWQLQ